MDGKLFLLLDAFAMVFSTLVLPERLKVDSTSIILSERIFVTVAVLITSFSSSKFRNFRDSS